MEKKQTAVDWLFLMINNPNDNQEMALKCLEKAKQMEREQIVNAFSEGTRMVDINDELSARFNACLYYVQTYGGQDE
jgi:hypothetical protein